MSEASNLLDLGRSSGKTSKDSSDISALLHGDDTQLVLFVDPDEECLLIVVEDSSALGPFTIQATSFEEAISFFEEEVVSDELIALGISHGSKRVERASELTLK